MPARRTAHVPVVALATLVALAACLPAPGAVPDAAAPAAATAPRGAEAGWRGLAAGAEIVRTGRGVPHITARDWGSAGFAMGWVQMEDYGIEVVSRLLSARGETARHYGPGAGGARVESDVRARRTHRRAVAAFDALPADVRAVYDGFARAVNRWLALHPADAPPSLHPAFTGADVLARDIPGPAWAMARRYAGRLESTPAFAAPDDDGAEAAGAEPGSNAWALAPSRTASGHAILMRNPHLSWGAGYYEARLTVTGDVDFHGDFRIGGPFGVIGGWNDRLGWSTTNNSPALSDLYRLAADPARPGRVRYDGEWVRLEEVVVEIEVLGRDGVEVETRRWLESPVGPVFHAGRDSVWVVRSAGDGEPRLGEQFLAMLRAHDLGQWLDAMRLHARHTSNFTYADADGNILYVWNALHPVRPHAYGADTVAHHVDGPDDVWRRYIPFDSLPRVVNPPGGYVRNENDPFHFTNLDAVLDPARFPPEFPAPRLRLRSQHSIELIGGEDRLTLEDVVARKHSERMLLADRVLDDLLAALDDARAARAAPGAGSPELEPAVRVLRDWDRTVAADARGAVLFAEWWDRFLRGAGRAPGSPESAGFPAPADRLFAEPWSPASPVTTPRGLADPDRAVAAFRAAAAATRDRWGAVDVAWGDVARARHGRLDLPVGGCDGLLGCFRVLWFTDDDDGRRRVRGGDGWVSAVEFGPVPRAYTILAYGQSARPESPHHEDQLADFVANRMTPVPWTAAEVEAAAARRYRPGH